MNSLKYHLNNKKNRNSLLGFDGLVSFIFITDRFFLDFIFRKLSFHVMALRGYWKT